ncbi:phosphatidylinositol 3,4,5-trisphosphate 5-phosphatase 1-like [Liolophura sinensis]|uniref:phosphatidylinositol 3,4,5-trisphosphate 5-phosphatase 1-like n=1 Tax=Liolophura sinensis TaxID=3198878 RepID=UPI003159518A
MTAMFHHKAISRMKAEDLLLAVNEDGRFLIRDSETFPGAHVLCLLYKGRVHQYRILPTGDGKLTVASEAGVSGPKFSDLIQLVTEYLQRGEKNGLACALKTAVEAEGLEEGDRESDDEEDFEVPRSGHNQSSEVHTAAVAKSQSVLAKEKLLHHFSQLDLSRLDGEFITSIRHYVDSEVYKDAQLLNDPNGQGSLKHLDGIIATAAASFQKELDLFMSKLNVCYELFSGKPEEEHVVEAGDSTLLSIIERKMSRCALKIRKLQQKAEVVVKDMGGALQDLQPSSEEAGNCSSLLREKWSSRCKRGTLEIPKMPFEVKAIKHGRVAGRVTLTVDIQAGKLFAVKPSKEVLDDSNTFPHDKILQLIKCTKDHSRLDIIIEGKRKYSYQFTDTHTRENFCQQVMQMKNMHSTEPGVDQISIFIGTFNMGSSPPPQNLNLWLLGVGKGKVRDPKVFSRIPHDVYVIGTQESALTDKDWINTLKSVLKSCFMIEMETVDVWSLWGIRLVILTRPEHIHSISHIQHASVKTGIANKLGNKGAVAISFQFNGTTFCFICSHLTSGDERLLRRNQNYKDIVKGFQLGLKSLSLFDITNRFQHVFWLGDLNYRTDGNIHHILRDVSERKIEALLKRDQLNKCREKSEAFCGFEEESITFMPTYRVVRGEQECRDYEWRKLKKTGERINSPSWCDRVLWKSYPGTFVENTAYGSSEKVCTSDHKPVFSSFNVGIASQFVGPGVTISMEDSSNMRIIFDCVEAKVKTSCNLYFYLEFFSTCLPGTFVSKANRNFDIKQPAQLVCNPVWTSNCLPEKMIPLFGDRDFLEDQHILLAVRARDGDNESYGECPVALKNMFSDKPLPFSGMLTHQGEETGSIRGTFRVTTSDRTGSRRKSARKTYELVAFDTEIPDPEEYQPDTPPLAKEGDTLPGEGKRLLKTASTDSGILAVKTPEANSQQQESHKRLSTPITLESPLYEESSLDENDTENEETVLTNGNSAPSLPPRCRPRLLMGQSSLSQNQVLPACVQSPTSPARTGGDKGENSAAPPPPPVPSRSPNTLGLQDRPPPPIPKRTKQEGYTNAVSDSRYDGLLRPSSVDEWLRGLGLPQYIALFLSNGWDTMEFLGDLSEADLDAMFIRDHVHRERIMESLKQMKLKT